MKSLRLVRMTLLSITVSTIVGTVGAAGAQQPPAGKPKDEAKAACMDMMQGSGVTEEGKKAMRDFMQSDKAPQAMANMMEMARKMGNGDPMLGMTKMMEMMGGGGMMGHQGGTMPDATQPKK